jgi:hypothetical protein
MLHLLKKFLDKLEPPANDWVLSRFGGCEAPILAPSAQVESSPADGLAPTGTPPLSAPEPFDRWFDGQDSVDAGPPQSGLVMSPNVSVDEPSTAERKSRTA